MKRTLLSTILFALAGLATESATAQGQQPQERLPQERQPFRPETTPPKSLYQLPDSLAGWTVWRPAADDPQYEALSVREAVPMTSVVVIRRDQLPAQTTVLLNNTLRVGRRLIISNGQAENWGPYPAGNADARTISMPMP
ncbi:MAG: hypothetical protein K2K43_00525 [Alistipes sp.]|nr:hypothetical protein [Alistipes sp.]